MGPIIEVARLGKEYELGGRRTGESLREAVVGALTAPARLFRRRVAVDRLWALRDVSFDVRAGEVVGIIGRNGAGKSTLLKILSRVTEPSEGRVVLRGRVGALLEVGTGFHPELTGRENVYLNGAVLGMGRGEVKRKFDDIIAFAEVERFLDTPVKHYSSGMYMRLAFAVAAHLEPEILIVDEVLAVGDAAFQKKCLGRMRDVAAGGRTVLFVSHNMNAVERLCGRVLVLEGGRISEDTTGVGQAVRRYMVGGEGVTAAEWVNRGNEYADAHFQPTRFAVCDAAGVAVTGPLPNDAPAWVRLEGRVRELDAALTIGYAIYAEDGQLLYWSYQTDGPEEEWPELVRGSCVLTSPLPRRLLNEGTYRLEVIGGLHHRAWHFEPGTGVPSIQLAVQGRLSDSPLWMAKRPGVIAPVMRWSVETGASCRV